MAQRRMSKKNSEKFLPNRYNEGVVAHGIEPHPLHPEFTNLTPSVNFAELSDDDPGVVKSITSNDLGDFYSVVFEPDRYKDTFSAMREEVSELVGSMSKKHGQGSKDPQELIRRATLRVVRRHMKNISRDESIEHVRKYQPEGGSPTLVSLEAFIRDGVGSSEHQAMLAAGILRDYYKIGAIDDAIYIDSSINEDKNTGKRNYSSWLRCESSYNATTIVDPTENFCGTLRTSLTEARINYLRDEDLERNPRLIDEIIDITNQIHEREAKAEEAMARKLGKGSVSTMRKTEELIEKGFHIYNKKFVIPLADKLIPEEPRPRVKRESAEPLARPALSD